MEIHTCFLELLMCLKRLFLYVHPMMIVLEVIATKFLHHLCVLPNLWHMLKDQAISIAPPAVRPSVKQDAHQRSEDHILQYCN